MVLEYLLQELEKFSFTSTCNLASFRLSWATFNISFLGKKCVGSIYTTKLP